jgi:hypothetical protein
MPRDADAHALLGLALVGQLRVDDAIAQFRTSLDIDPGHQAAREYLARALKAKQSGG